MTELSRDGKHAISFTLNGEPVSGHAEPRLLLTDFLNYELGLTGNHVGCEHGVCGACTILVDGVPGRACLTFAVQADGRDVMTVEGIAAATQGVGMAGLLPPSLPQGEVTEKQSDAALAAILDPIPPMLKQLQKGLDEADYRCVVFVCRR